MTTSVTKTHGIPNWTECGTLDLDKAEAFYGAVFGWTSERAPVSDGSVYAVQRLNGKTVAGIYVLNDELRAKGVPPHWGTYFEVDDVAAVLKKASDAGGTLIKDASTEPGVGTFGVVQDNVGAIANVWQSAAGNGAEVVNAPGAMTWNELCTKEPDKAAAFYQDVLGFEVATMETPARYTVLKLGDRDVAGILKVTPEMGDVPPNWEVYFATADIDATVNAALDAGGSVLREPFDVAGGMARMAVLQDPQGAVFEVITLPSDSG